MLLEELAEKMIPRYRAFPVLEILSMLVHKKICGAVLRRSGISFEKKMEELSRKELGRVVSELKAFSVSISDYPGFEAAQATMGGVDTKDLDENMMSKKVDGLYFIGEIVDIDDSTINTLFVVEKDGEEILIPAQEELIADIDHDGQSILFDLPQGLVSL
jgi:predicted flavoprotein YhiN